MDRYAIFVDAGYVLAEGGKLCCRTGDRSRLDLDVGKLRDHLNKIAADSTGLSPLRLYWYDAAPFKGPTSHHREIALLPNVKLRLGRIKSGRQKGVDALIYHDLVNLARERAICDAFLLSGDEDLREGVRTVQGMGVRVTLVGIPPSGQPTNQSLELTQEADERVILTTRDLSRLLRLKPEPGVQPGSRATPEDSPAVPTRTTSDSSVARDTGAALAETLKRSPQRQYVLRSRPRIPMDIDKQLLRSLREELATPDVDEDLRHEARASFWKTFVAVN